MRPRAAWLRVINRSLPAAAVLLGLTLALPADGADPGLFHAWSDEQKERFLLRAEIVSTRPLPEGVTHSLRAVLSDGKHEHDAQIQNIEVSKPHSQTARGWEVNFRDSYKFNVAAYRLSRLLGLDNVPVTVEREVQGSSCALSWWIDDVLMTEKTRFLHKIRPPDRGAWNRQIYNVRVFDELIYNTDRNLGNLVITNDWKLWMIDHTRAFRRHRTLREPKQLVKCGRAFLEAMRTLRREDAERHLADYLGPGEIDGLLARRDEIVRVFEVKVAAAGEAATLID